MTHVIADVPVYFYILGVLGLSFVFTLCAIKIAHWTDFVYRPVAYRWNTRTVALGGGTAILLAIVSGILLTRSSLALSILPPLFIVFALGLYDDRKGVGPWTKLTFEMFAAAWLFYFGFHFNFGPLYFTLPLSAVWFLGITNAQNIIDNMDGIAAGSAGISALGFALLFAMTDGSLDLQILAWLTSAACLGFLFLNFNPAKIFMGDAGSLPLGFVLGLLATAFTQVQAGSLLWKLFALANVLVIPLFDTFLVAISRKSTGRMIMAGGKDHTTHRLVKSGLNEKQTALVIYGIAMTGVLLALCTQKLETDWLVVVAAIWVIGLLWFARFLWAVPAYQAEVMHGKFQSKDIPRWVDSAAEKLIQIAGVAGVFSIARELVIDPEWKTRLGAIYGGTLTAALTMLVVSPRYLPWKKESWIRVALTSIAVPFFLFLLSFVSNLPFIIYDLIRCLFLTVTAQFLVSGVHLLRKRLKTFRIRFQIPDVVSKQLEVGS